MRRSLLLTKAAVGLSALQVPTDRLSLAERTAWMVIWVAERMLAVFGLIVLSPVLASAAFVIAILSRRSPFIAHRRVGLNGSTLWVFKLRTMWHSSEPEQACLVQLVNSQAITNEIIRQKQPEDSRISGRFARFCRKYSIDELPQLWNVALGEMCLVGARPITESELKEFYAGVAGEVLSLKPGITGLWQISGRNQLTFEERRHFDLIWTRKRSLKLYAGILLQTIPLVLSGKNSW
jgi:exopolysaccharide production protein ExoY